MRLHVDLVVACLSGSLLFAPAALAQSDPEYGCRERAEGDACVNGDADGTCVEADDGRLLCQEAEDEGCAAGGRPSGSAMAMILAALVVGLARRGGPARRR